MFNSIKKIVNKYTGLLIRMDDISENMNWKLMDKCEILFDQYKIKPLLGVIPNNEDQELLRYPKNLFIQKYLSETLNKLKIMPGIKLEVDVDPINFS